MGHTVFVVLGEAFLQALYAVLLRSAGTINMIGPDIELVATCIARNCAPYVVPRRTNLLLTYFDCNRTKASNLALVAFRNHGNSFSGPCRGEGTGFDARGPEGPLVTSTFGSLREADLPSWPSWWLHQLSDRFEQGRNMVIMPFDSFL